MAEREADEVLVRIAIPADVVETFEARAHASTAVGRARLPEDIETLVPEFKGIQAHQYAAYRAHAPRGEEGGYAGNHGGVSSRTRGAGSRSAVRSKVGGVEALPLYGPEVRIDFPEGVRGHGGRLALLGGMLPVEWLWV